MRITISGLPGSGTTTVAKLLSKEMNMEVISAGEMFREMAKKRGMSLEEFSELAEQVEEFDKEIDERQREEAMKREDVIVEGRMAGFFVPSAALRVWLKASLEERAKRVAMRERKGYEEALAEIKRREKSEYERYKKYYGIDLGDLSIYDLVIDTSKWGEEDVTAIIREAIERLKSKT
ncbi:MAG: (d)CMP kinase [Candidatus Methanospirareceae archaeon]